MKLEETPIISYESVMKSLGLNLRLQGTMLISKQNCQSCGRAQ